MQYLVWDICYWCVENVFCQYQSWMRIRSILYSSWKGNSINWRSCPRDIWRKLFPENFLNSSLVHYIDDNMLIEPDKYYGYLCKVHMLHRMLEKSYKNCILGGEKGTVLHCWWEYKLIQPVWKTVWRFLKKLGIKIPYDPTISILGTYPEKIITEKNTYIPVFIAALFIIARTWKQPRRLLTDE